MSITRTKLDDGAKSIIQHLSQLESSGFRPSEIVDDWISLCHATVLEIPRHYRSYLNKQPHQDSPEAVEALRMINDRYGERKEVLAQAMGVLLYLSQEYDRSYPDFLGEVYMRYGYPKTSQGQYFTPREVADLMGAVTSDKQKLKADMQERLADAVCASELATAASLVVRALPEELQLPWFLARVVAPALPHYKPVTVLDPGCGSGVLLLGMAKEFADWQVKMGMVQFYGMDTDRNCTKMAQTNIVLYGLNGSMRLPYIMQLEQFLADHGRAQEGEVVLPDDPQEEAVIVTPPGFDPAAIPVDVDFDPRDYKQVGLFELPTKDK